MLALDEVAQVIKNDFQLREPIDSFPQAPGVPIAGMNYEHRLTPHTRKGITLRRIRDRLALPGCPGRKRETQQNRSWDLRLRDNHRSRLQYRRPQARDAGQESVFTAF